MKLDKKDREAVVEIANNVGTAFDNLYIWADDVEAMPNKMPPSVETSISCLESYAQDIVDEAKKLDKIMKKYY